MLQKSIVLWRLAKKNTYRHLTRRRILVCIWAFGIVAVLFATSFVRGLVKQRIAERIDTSLGHAKITHKNYDFEKKSKYYLDNFPEISKIIAQKEKIIAHTFRLNTRGLCTPKKQKKISSFNYVDIYGVMPDSEKKIFALYKKIIKGNYLDTTYQTQNQIIIGNSFAQKEHISLHDTLLIQYFSKENNIIKRLYVVVGIFETQNELFDRTHIFTHKATWREYKINQFHQIIFRLNSYQDAYNWTKNQPQSLKSTFLLKSWLQISPDLAYLQGMMQVFFDFFLVLILGISVFGIAQIFMVMAQERSEEMRKLRDLGVQKMDLMLLFGYESLLYFLYALPYSVILGVILLGWGMIMGIDLSWFGEAMHRWGNDARVYLEIDIFGVLKLLFWYFFVAFGVGFGVIFFIRYF